MRVLAALSGGVDSAVAAALLLEDGHDVVGATMKLWRGAAVEVGCCSEAEIDDARAVARRLGIDHHVFTFTDDFDRHVVEPYVAGHAAGRTPNPCIACNDHIKFDRFLHRAEQLGFDAVATGHHARVERGDDGRVRLRRGADPAKDQSYVLHGLGAATLARCLFPVGRLTKAEVRERAAGLELPVATKPDSQDACFVLTEGGRGAFLGTRIPLRPGRLVDAVTGEDAGSVPALELVTVGQRRGMGGAGQRRYALAVDVDAGTVTVGPREATLVDAVAVEAMGWIGEPVAPGTSVLVQCSAHGDPAPATYVEGLVTFASPRPRVAPGQSVVLYDGDEVLGGAEAA